MVSTTSTGGVLRISTAGLQHDLVSRQTTLQGRLAELQNQISSGKRVDEFAEMSKEGITRTVLGFESNLKRISSYQNNNTLILTRLERMDDAIEEIENILEDYRKVLTQKRSANEDLVPMTSISNNSLSSITDLLNSEVAGRFVFAGGKGNSPAVSDLRNVTINGSGNPNSDYYLGDDAEFEVRVNDELRITYNEPKANHLAFQRVIGAIHRGIDADNGNDTALEEAIGQAEEAQQLLAQVRNTVNNNIVTIEEVQLQHDRFKTYLNQQLGETIGTDVAAAVTEVSLNEALLTASYQVYARLSELSLTNFLR